MVSRSLVSVVDDDHSVRESLRDLLDELGYEAHAFSSAEEFLSSQDVGRTECLIVDVVMPGMSGPDLLRGLRSRGWQTAAIFITANADASTRPRLLQLGAVECLIKPFSDIELREALVAAHS
jgi:FixJ family two-component response regulator